MSSDDEITEVQLEISQCPLEEQLQDSSSIGDSHYERVMKQVDKGKMKGLSVVHFQCKHYTKKPYQGPSTGTILKHLRANHPKEMPKYVTRRR